MKQIIWRIVFNWFYSATNGEEYSDYVVDNVYLSNKKCVAIIEHRAMGEGDKWCYDVTFDDQSVIRIFNPNMTFTKTVNK